MSNNKKIRVSVAQLIHPITGWGDWHDRPLRYVVVTGDSKFEQHFPTIKEAQRWASIRRNSDSELAAIHTSFERGI